ncbi:MAG TPA: zinc ABC transporter substrate-binding protein [Spirochaetia bacterium]
MRHRLWGGVAGAALALLFLLSASAAIAQGRLKVVAAENFYGDIAQQIGGARVEVTSVLSDPNIDPHEYESSVSDAKAVADADLVVENGGGYDDWMDKLLSASPKPSRTVLIAFDIAPTKLPDNEHVWYGIDNGEAVAAAIAESFTRLAPSGTAEFARNLTAFRQSLAGVRGQIARIKARWPRAPVGLTETIFLYQTGPLGLSVLTPLEFQKAIAEGNDPPAEAVIAAESQVKGKKIRALIYNEQTVSPITTRLLDAAHAARIPVVPVTETMPSAMNYQRWMASQLTALEQALGR